jgi:prephenate dehydrogenase
MRRADPSLPVTGYDRDPAAVTEGLARGALTAGASSAEEAVRDATLVVLAIPVDRIPDALERVGRALAPGAVVTDVGSAKGAVVASGETTLGERFVGGHPMAGSERHGMGAADERLFEGAWWILTPTASTSSAAYGTVSGMVTTLGATPVAVGPLAHDELVARLSHLPQITASALVEVATDTDSRDALLGLAAGGFRDVTRIAASDPDLWVAVLRSNREAVLKALEGFQGRLSGVARLLEDRSWEELGAFFARSKAARLDLFAKPDLGGQPITLSLLIPDRPGVLAEVTTAAGSLGANIEDLRIFHSTEGGRGRLEVVIAGAEAAEALGSDLERLGYHVDRGAHD